MELIRFRGRGWDKKPIMAILRGRFFVIEYIQAKQ